VITGATRVYGLVGHPVRHSLSPAMHNELFRRCGVDGVYVTFDVAPERAGSVVAAVRALALAGVNLTVPFKERVLPDLDDLGEEARLAGAVNVVVRREDGALVGHNTDGAGYVDALRAELDLGVEGEDVAILGAGGTGRAVAAAVAAAGAGRVTLYNRTPGRAERGVDALSRRFDGTAFDACALAADAFAARAGGHTRVVNCTSGPGAPLVDALPVDALPPGCAWTDANYWMADPPRLAACARRGLRIQRGIGMLIHQGARSFAHFTGHSVGAETIRAVLDVGGW
jgi:shikimate dehydrogenase